MDIKKLIPENYSGVITIKKGTKSIYNKALGYADMPNKRRNRLDTKFPTASAGKAFVAVGILKLIEEGKLNFDTTIKEVLDFDLHQIDPDITIHQLLTHTSGIPDYCDEEVVTDYADLFVDYPNYKIRTSKDMIPLFIDMPMKYPKGQRFEYNNTGFVVLGLIIEFITKQPFDVYLKNEIFIPCNMLDTMYCEYDRLPANCANVYIYDEKRKEYYTNIYSSTAKGVGDGGAFTTSIDVEKFWKGLFLGKVISLDMVEKMITSKVPEGNYGYGVWIRNINNRYVPYFQGSEPGISFISGYDNERDILITLISNTEDSVWKINRAIIDKLYNE